MEFILGIDIGTGSTKAVAVDMDYAAITSSQYFYPTSSPQAGYSEQNPELIWEAFKQSIKALVSTMKSNPLAISLSTAMHSLIAVDAHCKALAPMITWADSRSTAIADNLLSSDLGKTLYRTTGTPIHAMSPLCKIIWIRENQPELFKKTHKFISIKEYIWYRLFRSFEVDHSIASCTGLMDVQQLIWSENALATAGISTAQLSDLVSTSYCRTDFDPLQSLSFLAAATPFIMGASDGCLANLGTGAVSPGNAALTIGTSGALRVAGNRAVFNDEAMTFSYRLDEKTFINGGPVNNGGVALKWHLKNVFQKEVLTDHDYGTALDGAALVAAGAEALLFLPYLQGERAPIWNAKSCGTFFGLRLHHHSAHFTRAVLEGICYALNDVLLSLEASGQSILQLNVSGGFVSSALWLQLMADITGKKLFLAATEDASAIGAAYIAFKAIGLTSDYPLPDSGIARLILPNPVTHQVYTSYFVIYRKLYQQLKGLMTELDVIGEQNYKF